MKAKSYKTVMTSDDMDEEIWFQTAKELPLRF